ncbi:hypothetical protein [uncultured Polaribacter sp.]|uniref:hypothetical protein n=1 Tax=uncultured Polaribacter sp. TaxID=174711 RepID=UPI002636E0ED|nr:hypothetical protein [uncultured Polaribacter sp.]
MKNLIIVIVLFISYCSVGQEAPKMPKYNAKNAANIFYYDLLEAPEKIKVKNDLTKNKMTKALRNYNDKVKNISFLNSAKLQELELTINTLGEQLYKNRDLALEVRKKIEATILPIRDSIVVYEKSLNSNLEENLSKKQFKKWLKYQKATKRKLLPERPKSQNNPPSNMNSRRNGQGGMGGRRF